MNRKIETFKEYLVMQKTLVKFMHRKIVFWCLRRTGQDFSKIQWI